MLCKTCNENVLRSDIIGNNCVYCFSYEEEILICKKCKKVQESLTYEMCEKCYNEVMGYK